MYELIAGPPVFVGGVNETVADPFPILAVTPVGTPGLPAGLTDPEDAEPELLPVALLATVENEYEVPLVRPVIVQEDAGEMTVHVAPPGVAVTVYEVGAPPEDGATTVIVALPSPAATSHRRSLNRWKSSVESGSWPDLQRFNSI